MHSKSGKPSRASRRQRADKRIAGGRGIDYRTRKCRHAQQLTAIAEVTGAGTAQRDDRSSGTSSEQDVERRDAACIVRGQDSRQHLALGLVGTDQVDRRPDLRRQLAGRRWIKDRIEPQLVSANKVPRPSPQGHIRPGR